MLTGFDNPNPFDNCSRVVSVELGLSKPVSLFGLLLGAWSLESGVLCTRLTP